MPRRSAASLAYPLSGTSRHLRPTPPSDLTNAEKADFLAIVGTMKAGHFHPADAKLIALYVQAIALARKTGEQAEANPNDALPGLLKLYGLATQRVVSLARSLRLTPLSRSPSKGQTTNDDPNLVSYYDLMDAERAAATVDDDDAGRA